MTAKTKILVVDDEKVVRDGCNRVLTGKGFEILTAENGLQAMEILAQQAVDIILLDLKMPVMSGEEVLEKACREYPEIPIIIITGHGTIDTAVECMKEGAYDFVTKPFQIDPFLLTINRAADKRELEKKARLYEEEKQRNLYDISLEKSRLKTIINCMANGVMVCNRNLELVLHNPAFMRLLEISKEIEDPVPVKDLIQDESLLATLKKIHSFQSQQDEVISQEIEAGKHTLRAISAPVLGPEKEIVGTVTVLEDITLYKHLDEMKSDFVNMVAHELRSPLSAIRQQNSVVLEELAGPLSEKQKSFLGRGIKKIDTLLELINELLNIARIEAGKHIQHQIPTDISQVIKETIALLEPQAAKHRVRLSFSSSNLKPILADPQRIEEVFNNLITNAINYSPDGGEVSVMATGISGHIEVRVEDSGVGIPPEEVPKIFDKFYRVKHPKTRQVMGTGLGLSIVKGIMDSHHGSIDVESTLNQGTTFRLLFPAIVENKTTGQT